jgi:hypothetical protein
MSQLNTVSGIGTVHSYQRYADREKQLADLYQNNGRLHGWFIRRVSVVEKVFGTGDNIEQSIWLIRGYLAINDVSASELEFDALLDSIRAVFRVDAGDPWQAINVSGDYVSTLYTDQPSKEQIGFSVLDSQPVLFSGVLCHSAECQLITNRVLHNPPY